MVPSIMYVYLCFSFVDRKIISIIQKIYHCIDISQSMKAVVSEMVNVSKEKH